VAVSSGVSTSPTAARPPERASPKSDSTWSGRSTRTQPSTEGPSTIPATISSTTDGNRSLGARPTSSGTAKATAATTTTPANESSAMTTSEAMATVCEVPRAHPSAAAPNA
jgi:hypothetical protein